MATNEAPIPSEDALMRDVERAPAERDRVGDTVDPVDEHDGVGGLRRDGCSSRAHRDSDIGEGERGRVVDPVADHHDRAQFRSRLERSDDVELLLGRLVGVDAVDAEPLPDGLCHRSLVAGHHAQRAGSRPRADAARAGRHRSGAGRRSARPRPRRRRRRSAPSRRHRDLAGSDASTPCSASQ